MRDLGRRALVGCSVALCAAPAVLSRAFASALSKPGFGRQEAKVLLCMTEVFRDLEGMQDIGKRWLEIISNKSTRSQVLAELMSEPVPQDPGDFRRYIAEKRDRDFRSDNVVIVDGWILSRTEARTCARAFLLSGRAAAG